MHIRGLAVYNNHIHFQLVSNLIPFRFQTFARSFQNATLPFAELTVISSSVCTALERETASQVVEFITDFKSRSSQSDGQFELYDFACAG